MITTHVTSLELSKQLYEAGIKIESEFYWLDDIERGTGKFSGDWMIVTEKEISYRKDREHIYPAPLSSELGELLPRYILVPGTHYSGDHVKNEFWLEIGMEWNRERGLESQRLWTCYYTNGDENFGFDRDNNWNESDTEANARAKMLLYLKEKGLM